MHRPVCITYDSTCDLTPQLLERFRIRTVPLTIQSGERVFPDDGRYTSAVRRLSQPRHPAQDGGGESGGVQGIFRPHSGGGL